MDVNFYKLDNNGSPRDVSCSDPKLDLIKQKFGLIEVFGLIPFQKNLVKVNNEDYYFSDNDYPDETLAILIKIANYEQYEKLRYDHYDLDVRDCLSESDYDEKLKSIENEFKQLEVKVPYNSLEDFFYLTYYKTKKLFKPVGYMGNPFRYKSNVTKVDGKTIIDCGYYVGNEVNSNTIQELIGYQIFEKNIMKELSKYVPEEFDKRNEWDKLCKISDWIEVS